MHVGLIVMTIMLGGFFLGSQWSIAIFILDWFKMLKGSVVMKEALK